MAHWPALLADIGEPIETLPLTSATSSCPSSAELPANPRLSHLEHAPRRTRSRQVYSRILRPDDGGL
jgi:hypothetical protein